MEENRMAETESEMTNTAPGKTGLTLEQAFARLDELAVKLEEKDVPLEESFRLYKEGMDLLKFCRSEIDTVEKKMQVITEDGELRDFDQPGGQ